LNISLVGNLTFFRSKNAVIFIVELLK